LNCDVYETINQFHSCGFPITWAGRLLFIRNAGSQQLRPKLAFLRGGGVYPAK